MSAFLPYRSGFSYEGAGALGSEEVSRLKTWVLIPWDEPKDPMTMEAWRGFFETRSCTGISFWFYIKRDLV